MPARKILPFCPAYVREQEKAVTVAAKSGQCTTGETGKGHAVPLRKPKESGRRVLRKIPYPSRIAWTYSSIIGVGI